MPSEIGVYGDIILFGIRVLFAFEDRDALNTVLAAYAPWSNPKFQQQSPTVYVVIKSRAVGDITVPDGFEADGTRLAISRGGIAAHADGQEGRGRCDYPRDAAHSEALAEAVNTIVLFLVAHAGRIPLHASAVMLGATAVVFAGRSGAGKSTLALAASRAGLQVLSDDTIFIQTVPGLRIWSLPQAIHVFEKDAPDDVGTGMRFRSGRLKKSLPIAAACQMAERAMVCVLAHGERVSLEPVAPEEAVIRLTANPESGYEFYGERSVIAARALAGDCAWRLTLSSVPADAIELVRRSFAPTAHADRPLTGIA